MPRRIIWLLMVVLLLAPVFGSLSLTSEVVAQDDTSVATPDVVVDGSPVAEVTPEGSPTVETTATPDASVTTEPAATETPTELPTDVVPPEPTVAPTGTPTSTPTAGPTKTVASAGLTSASDLTITLDCRSNPEWFKVTNNGSSNIQFQSITTLFDVSSAEPFASSRTLMPGKTTLFQSGSAASKGTVLSTGFLFTNSAYEADGVQIETSAGTATQTCAPKPPLDVSRPGKVTDLSFKLSCRSYAETIRVTNNGNGYIRLTRLGTLFDARANEPFAIDHLLYPGKSALFQAGSGASHGTVLTTKYIFTNTAWKKDGLRLVTSVGAITKTCDPKPAPPEHWIDIDLSGQYLIAYEGNKQVNSTLVSTGRPGFDTPTGTYYILVKYRYDDMEGVINGEYYNVPVVPWTMYFTDYGHALHGTYWHNDFGNVRSHGCVNLPLGFAEWLYYWLPYGGRVVIHY